MKKFTGLFVLIGLLGMGNLIRAQEIQIGTPGTNYSKIEADGTLEFDGDATVWDDLMVFPDATSKGSSNPPTMTSYRKNGAGTSQGTFIWMFAAGTEQELYFTVQIPHSYKVGTDLLPHVHWTTTSTTPGNNVTWSLEYTAVAFGGAFSTTNTISGYNIIRSYLKNVLTI